jgi:hypothetical protein
MLKSEKKLNNKRINKKNYYNVVVFTMLLIDVFLF